MSLKSRLVDTAPQTTTVSYAPNATVVQKGEPGAIVDSGMPYRQVKNSTTYQNALVTPVVKIGVYDGIVSYETMQPMSDGSGSGLLIPEDSPGRWGQLYRAGRIY